MAMLRSDLEKLFDTRVQVIDGATGTELERRGVPTGLPLWSAPALLDHPAVVEQIHAEYVDAGVDFLTTNTFRTQRRALSRGGLADRAIELTSIAAGLARRAGARARHPVHLLGSAPTLEDCYRPDLVPDDPSLALEHGEHAENLVAAGVDAILVETMNSVREALAGLRAARAAGAPAIVSFVCWEGARLLSGEPLSLAIDRALAEEPVAIAVNCLPPSNVESCLPVLAAAGIPFGVYANLGEPDDDTGFARDERFAPAPFAEHTARWIDAGARLVGGCCGTTPAHLRAVVEGTPAP